MNYVPVARPMTRFSIRTLLLVVAIVGVVLYVPRHRSLSQHSAAKRLAQKGVTFILHKDRPRQSMLSRIIYGDDRYDFVNSVNFTDAALTQSETERLFRLFPPFARERFSIDIAYIKGCQDADPLLKAIGELTSVNRLSIYESRFTQAGMKSLGDLENINDLTIDVPAEGFDAEILTGFSRMNSLKLRGEAVDDDIVRVVSTMKHIQILQLYRTSLTDAGMPAIAEIEWLQVLDIVDAKSVSGTSLQALQRLEHLRRLDLGGCPIDDDALSQIARIQALQSLTLRRTNLSEQSILELKSKMPQCDVNSDFDDQ